MSSPYSTGGGGIHFETSVAAYYFAATLGEAQARALPGSHATEVSTQRAAFEEPLDDLVISGISSEGADTKLSLQVKSSLTFTKSDNRWISVLGQAWDTFKRDTFDGVHHRLGVAIGSYNARVDKYYQSVLTWASHSPSADNFFERTLLPDFAHKNQRDFVDGTRMILTDHSRTDVSDDDLWEFLCTFRILHFDFRNEESSRDAEAAIDRIRRSLKPEEYSRAAQIWDHLIVRAGETVITGGGETRATLLSRLESKGLPASSSWTFRDDVKKIDRESKRGLEDITPDIHGLRLKRNTSYDEIQDALAKGRFVQIVGEPGSGKSALLRQLAEEEAQTGPLFFLKDMRIQQRGWAAHAGLLGVTDDLAGLLSEFSSVGGALLFIDGIDKISDPAVQLTVNDLVRAVAKDQFLSNWKILVTVREQNLEHISTWLDRDALKFLPIQSVIVPLLDKDELSIVSAEFPRLRPLLLEAEEADVILRRPFFLKSIITRAGHEGTTALPASEAELLKSWWNHGGSDDPSFEQAQPRRKILIALAERFLLAPTAPVSIDGLSSRPLSDLRNAGVIRDVNLGHTVTFSHDIYEEWSLCQWLMSQVTDIPNALRSAGEAQELVRPLQLFGAYALEFENTNSEWRDLFGDLSPDDIRPVWQHALLTSCLRSTRTVDILRKLSDFLSENNHAVLKKLLNALQALEVVPNISFLSEEALPNLKPEERVQYSHALAYPKILTWARFLDWFFASGSPPPSLIPELVPVFKTWQSVFSGGGTRHCRQIGELAHTWLTEFETTFHSDQRKNRRDPFGIKFPHDRNLEKEIRSLFLLSTGDVPRLAAEYLVAKTDDQLFHMYRKEILGHGNTIALFVSRELTDYIMAVCFIHPKNFNRPGFEERELGLVDNSICYPASPLQPPFLVLLRQHPKEGLRLVREVCNYSVDVWRWQKKRPTYERKGLTPIAVEIAFPWGVQSFWGGEDVYRWFRGGSANNACRSSLMALEYWAFERIDAGDDFAEVLQTVIKGHESVAVLGVAVSLCIAHPNKALEQILPLMTCPHVWQWDLPRAVSDRTSSHLNEMGDWVSHHILLTAVRDLNRKPHRKFFIRDMVPYFVFCGDKDLRERYTAGIRSFPERLPFMYEEDKIDEARVDSLRWSMELYVEQADPQYWHSERTQDGKQVKFWNDPPSTNTPERLEQMERHTQTSRYLRLSGWAQKCLDENTLQQDITLFEALAEAKRLDVNDLFESDDSEFDRRQEAGAISGVAYVLAKFAGQDIWDEATATWVTNTLRRAAIFTDKAEIFRGSILLMHPLTFAVHGNAALIARGHDLNRSQQEIFKLALNSFDSVVEAVAVSSASFAEQAPAFRWEVFALLVRRCISKHGYYYSPNINESERQHREKLIEDAETALAEATASILPLIPLPWVEKEDRSKDTTSPEYERNSERFLTDFAEKTIFKTDMESFMSRDDQRRQILLLVEQMLEMTFQEMAPPFAESRPGYQGRAPFEWNDFFSWLGSLCRYLTPGEIDLIILKRIFAADNKSALLAMDNLSQSFAVCVLLPQAVASEEALSVWGRIADWIIENREGDHLKNVDHNFSQCVFTLMFCFSEHSGLVCYAERGWETLPKCRSIIERIVNKFGRDKMFYHGVIKFMAKGGFDFVPDPGIWWLRDIATNRRDDRDFWTTNGSDTVNVLKSILNDREDVLTLLHRKTISFVLDVLVDNGVRSAGFLRHNQHRKN